LASPRNDGVWIGFVASLLAITVIPIKIVITGLDPLIHLRKKLVTKIDGCPDQVRA
jgi:hypothetical protein